MKIVIVGGVAGGASAAARARRLSEDAEIVVFERGPYISFANCGLPYHIGGTIAEHDKLLVQTPEKMKMRFGIDVRVNTEVTAVDRQAKEVALRETGSGNTYRESYDKLILSPGAAPVRPPIPGAKDPRVHVLRNIPDMDAIIASIEDARARRAVVIGGGYIGLEVAENLRERDLEVTVVEMLDQVMPPFDPEMAAELHKALRRNGVKLQLGQRVMELEDAGSHLVVKTESGLKMEAELVLMSVGVKPETRLAEQAGLALGVRGTIVVDEHMQTADPDIYAVGDAVQVTDFVTGKPTFIPLAGPANRQGRIAADHIFGRDSAYTATQGTAVVKVFDITAGCTGAGEKVLRAEGIPYLKSYTHSASHATYYPGAEMLHIKLLFAPDDGKVLGAQVVGRDGVDKRVDVLATALRMGATVYDLEQLELAYAPPYGSAKDPVNMAGFVAANILKGDVTAAQFDEATPPSDRVLLDVRTTDENLAGQIPGSVNIPVDQLRSRLNELPKNKPIDVYCAVGLRGYIGARILQQHGFRDVRNLSGGYKTYCTFATETPGATCPGDSEGPEIEPRGGSKKKDVTEAAGLSKVAPHVTVDARGLQCPGPIMKLREALEGVAVGETVEVHATDHGFPADVDSWCGATGNELLDKGTDGQGDPYAVVRRGAASMPGAGSACCPSSAPQSTVRNRETTLVVFSGDLDKVMASFIIANGAATMGHKVTLFFTFWGLNVLRRRGPATGPVKKSFLDRMFGWMMPRGAEKLKLSKMNMMGMGTAMMKHVMRTKNVESLPRLIELAKSSGVRMVACTMSMDVMGIGEAELIDGIEFGGVAAFMSSAQDSAVNMFV